MSNGIRINMSNIMNTDLSENKNLDGKVKETKGIFVGNLGLNNNQGINPLIEQKRKLAGKQAMKLISDAWERDNKSADAVSEMKEIKQEKIDEANELNAKINEIDEQKAALQKQYGVSDESQEQKDLELLQKYQNNKNGVSYDEFSKEELERLNELQHTERTEYQARVLELNNVQGVYRTNMENADYTVQEITKSITDTKIEQLKSQDMLNATDAADAIKEAANKEIMGMVIQDAKEKIDEEMEEEKEKIEEAKEEKEEFEEKIEERKEEREAQEELIEGEAKINKLESKIEHGKVSNASVLEARKDIEKILIENNLINEDIKGLNIDLGF